MEESNTNNNDKDKDKDKDQQLQERVKEGDEKNPPPRRAPAAAEDTNDQETQQQEDPSSSLSQIQQIDSTVVVLDDGDRTTTTTTPPLISNANAKGNGDAINVNDDRRTGREFPIGYRFCPHEDELVGHYLWNKLHNLPLSCDLIQEVEIYRYSPHELAERYNIMGEKEWYFFTPRDRKYKYGKRPNRATVNGYWKATGVDKTVKDKGRVIGRKKTLAYYEGKPRKGDKTHWLMHEFRVEGAPTRVKTSPDDMRLDDWVLCRIYRTVDRSRRDKGRDDDDDQPQEVKEDEQNPPPTRVLAENNNNHETQEGGEIQSILGQFATPHDFPPSFEVMAQDELEQLLQESQGSINVVDLTQEQFQRLVQQPLIRGPLQREIQRNLRGYATYDQLQRQLQLPITISEAKQDEPKQLQHQVQLPITISEAKQDEPKQLQHQVQLPTITRDELQQLQRQSQLPITIFEATEDAVEQLQHQVQLPSICGPSLPRERSANLRENIPIGYRFCPHDGELVAHYLCNKIDNLPLPCDCIPEVKLYQYNPQQLAERYDMIGDKEWYFFTARDRKYKNRVVPNRTAGNGFWKSILTDTKITYRRKTVGYRKQLVYYEGQKSKVAKTEWRMHEFRAEDAPTRVKTSPDDMRLDDWVLCQIYRVGRSRTAEERDDDVGPLKRNKDDNIEMCNNLNQIGDTNVLIDKPSNEYFPPDIDVALSQLPEFVDYPSNVSNFIGAAPVHNYNSDQPTSYDIDTDLCLGLSPSYAHPVPNLHTARPTSCTHMDTNLRLGQSASSSLPDPPNLHLAQPPSFTHPDTSLNLGQPASYSLLDPLNFHSAQPASYSHPATNLHLGQPAYTHPDPADHSADASSNTPHLVLYNLLDRHDPTNAPAQPEDNAGAQ